MSMYNILKNVSLFSCLSEHEMEILEKISIEKTYKKNTMIMTEGDKSNSLYVVLSGKAQAVSIDQAGKEIVLNVFGQGDYFGEMSFIDHEPRCASIKTKEDARLLIVAGDRFREILLSNPNFMFMIMKGLLQKIRTATRQIETLAFRNAYERVVHLLTEVSKPHGDKRIIDEKLTQQSVAERIGISREVVNRIMKELSEGGFITKQESCITIHKDFPDKW